MFCLVTIIMMILIDLTKSNCYLQGSSLSPIESFFYLILLKINEFKCIKQRREQTVKKMFQCKCKLNTNYLTDKCNKLLTESCQRNKS